MRRIRRHPRLSTVAAVIIAVFVIAGITAPKKHAAAQPSATTATTAARPVLSDAEKSARSYIQGHGADATQVQTNIMIVQLDVASQGSLVKTAQDAQTAHDNLDAIRDNFATTDISGHLGDSEVEVFAAANDLKNAMGSLVAYTGNPNPATLAQFTSKYRSARGEWNAGVGGVWHAAHRRGMPTI